MHKRLNAVWNSLGCEVIDKLGVSRHIIKNGVTLVSGGFQREIEYLQIKHPESLNEK